MNVIAPYVGILPEGWLGGEGVTKRWRNEFIHLYRVHRPCKTCGTEIRIDVTKRALEGFSKNAGLLLRNCPSCREQRKAGGVGSRGGTSRPVADALEAVQAPAETAQMMIETMKAELDGLYEVNRELRDRLAQYELPAFMRAAKEKSKKMPWEA